MARISFLKMNGAGNDFVMLDNRDGSHQLSAETIARLCDRHRGIGADGVLVIEPAQSGADHRMRYYNADGGEAEMCGNGARCFARFAQRTAGAQGKVSFETPAGVIRAEFVEGERVRIQMVTPTDYAPSLLIEVEGGVLKVHSINTGVPHACVFVDDLENTPVFSVGRALRRHAQFAPKGTNANFIKITGPQSISIRTYERGVEDETLACGTGVTACALIYAIQTGAPSPIDVRVKGGDTLQVGFVRGSKAGEFSQVTLSGPADFVFEGTVEV
ncbi:MAG: diaminopimelate epimerase [Verrucomicrobia bacterium]|nr:diaminopimelate epimerase [Verrucomicrobiota bacterium]